MNTTTGLDADYRVCWWLLLGFALLAPFMSLTGIPIAWDDLPLMDWQRLFEIVAVLGSLAWALVSAPAGARPAPTLKFWALAFGLGLVSALLVAEHRDFALLEWSWILLLVTQVGLFRQWGSTDRAALDQPLLWGVLVSSIAYLAWFWTLNGALYFAPALAEPGQIVNFPGFSNIRYFSDYQSLVLLLLPLAVARLTPEKGIFRPFATLAIAGYFALAIIAGSRSLVTAHLLLHTTLLILLRQRYWPFLATQLRFWVYGMVIYGLVTWLPPLLATGGHPTTSVLWRTDSSSRTVLWQLALDVLQRFPLLGIGPMHYANIPNQIASHPHNLVLQFATEWGLPATLILIWLVGHEVFRRMQFFSGHLSDPTHDVGRALSYALFALLAQSMVAGTLNYPTSQVLALLCFAYPAGNLALMDKAPAKTGYALHVAGVIALVLCVGTLTTLQSIRERNRCFHLHPWPSSQFATRFWQQGWLVGPCSAGQSLLSRALRQPQQ